jgi:hypothetical protein
MLRVAESGFWWDRRYVRRWLKDLEKKYDSQFKVVFDAIRQLMNPPARKPRQIGFKVKDSGK